MGSFLRKGFVDPEGYWPGIYAIAWRSFTTPQVAPKDVPKRYEDLLDARWKGNMIMDLEAHDLFAGLIDLWGEAKRQAPEDFGCGTKGPIFTTIAYLHDTARRYRRV